MPRDLERSFNYENKGIKNSGGINAGTICGVDRLQQAGR